LLAKFNDCVILFMPIRNSFDALTKMTIRWSMYRKVQLVPKFKEYDADGNGFITLEEASYILESPPFNFPPAKVVFLLKHFDKDGNGKLDIEEFAGFYAEAKATLVLHIPLRRCL